MADIIIEHKSAEVGTTTPNESIEVIVSRHSVDCIVGGYKGIVADIERSHIVEIGVLPASVVSSVEGGDTLSLDGFFVEDNDTLVL